MIHTIQLEPGDVLKVALRGRKEVLAEQIVRKQTVTIITCRNRIERATR